MHGRISPRGPVYIKDPVYICSGNFSWSISCSMKNALPFYTSIWLSLSKAADLTLRKHKRINIGVTVIFTALYMLSRRILRPPKALRQVPQVATIPYSLARLRNETMADVTKKHVMPVALSTDHGLYTVSERCMIKICAMLSHTIVTRIKYICCSDTMQEAGFYTWLHPSWQKTCYLTRVSGNETANISRCSWVAHASIL